MSENGNAPVLSVEQQLRIENMDLKAQLLITQLQGVQREAQAIVDGLRLEGYELKRDASGRWFYEPSSDR